MTITAICIKAKNQDIDLSQTSSNPTKLFEFIKNILPNTIPYANANLYTFDLWYYVWVVSSGKIILYDVYTNFF